jgi:hypothetical protein
MEKEFTIDSQSLLAESQNDNSQRAEDLDTVPEEKSNTIDTSNETDLFTTDSSFDRWAAHDPSISGEPTGPMDSVHTGTNTPNPEGKFLEMSTPDREFCLNLEKTFEENQQAEKIRQLTHQLDTWSDKYVTLKLKGEEETEHGMFDVAIHNDTNMVLLTIRGQKSTPQQIQIDTIEWAKPIPHSQQMLHSIFECEDLDVEIHTSDGQTLQGQCMGLHRHEMGVKTGSYAIKLLEQNPIDKRPRVLYVDLSTVQTLHKVTTDVKKDKKNQPDTRHFFLSTLERNMDKKVTIHHQSEEEREMTTGVIHGFHKENETISVVLALEKDDLYSVWNTRFIKLDDIITVVKEEEEETEEGTEDLTLHISEESSQSSDDEGGQTKSNNTMAQTSSKTTEHSKQRDTPKPTTPKRVTSPKVHKRTAKGWEEDPSAPKMTYAEKAKRSKQPLNIVFEWTAMGNTTPTPPEDQKKQKWIKALEDSINKEITRAHDSSEWPDFLYALHKSLKSVGIEVARHILRHNFNNLNDSILQDQKGLDKIWNFIQELFDEHEDQGENLLNQKRTWEDTVTKEFDTELDKAIRENGQPDYRYAVVQAFRKQGNDINPAWISRYQIDENTPEDRIKMESIWDTVHRYLTQENEIRYRNRLGKCEWASELNKAAAYEEHRARLIGQRVDYRAAVLYSLAVTGRLITPERLVGLEPKFQDAKFLTDHKVLSAIWERACLELDHETLVVQGKASSQLDQKPLKMDRRTRWARKLKEVSYATLISNRRLRTTQIDHEDVIQNAFHSIGWNFKRGSFRKFRSDNRFSLLDRQVQNAIWHTACETRERENLSVSYSEFPADVLRREWQKALNDIIDIERAENKYKGTAKYDYTNMVVKAFAEIAWKVPHTTFSGMQIQSCRDLLNPQMQKHLWFKGCSVMKKPREFYINSGRDLLMSPDFEHELAPGIRKYTELPMTLDDKVDKTQLNFDYQRTMELHQLSFIDWMEKSNITKLMTMGGQNLQMDEPDVLKKITQAGNRDFFIANWMMDFYNTKLNFEMWYNYIGKDLKIPKTADTNAEEEQARTDDSWATTIPTLYDHTQHLEKIQKKDVCILQMPQQTPIKPEEKKEEPFSWATDVERHLPLQAGDENTAEASHYTNEPAIMSEDGKFLNKEQRRQYYLDKETDMKQTIKDEAMEKAMEDLLTVEQYKAIAHTMAIKLPPMKRTTWELESIKGNTILDPRIEVPWVEPYHFTPGGALQHIFIPKYVYIPKDVFARFNIWLDKDTTSYIVFWRHLREAQHQANKLITPEQLKSAHKTDYRKMLKHQTPKTVHTTKRDIIQHAYAHVEAEKIGWRNMKLSNIYDWFIRPLERYFAIDMPQGAALMRAMLYPKSAHRLTDFIMKYTGIKKNILKHSVYVIEEMSRIRMAYEAEYQQAKAEDTPMYRIPKVRLEEDPTGTCYVKTTHEGNTQQSVESEEEQGDQTSIYDDEVATWDNIMKDYDKAMSLPVQYGQAHAEWMQKLIKKTHKEAKKLLDKCRQQYIKVQSRHTKEQEKAAPVTMTKRERSLTREDSSNSSTKGDETNLAQMFRDKLYIKKRHVKTVIDNPKLLKTAEERKLFQEVDYYRKAVDEAQLDLIKCDPTDTEFIDILSRARDNCNKAYLKACKDLQEAMDRKDQEELNASKRYVQEARRKTAEQENGREATPSVDNKVTPKMEPQAMAPSQQGQERRNFRSTPRPTAWPNAQQIRAQNPYRGNQRMNKPPSVEQPKMAERSPSQKKKNPPWRSNQDLDYTEPSPPNLRRNPRYDPNFSQVDSPSSESFVTDATVTSTPTKKKFRIEEGTNKPPRTRMTQMRPRTPDYQVKDQVYDDRENLVKNSAQQQVTGSTARQRSPTPPRPGGNTKFIRKKAPDGNNLFHYKLWKQLDVSTPPSFTRHKLSAEEVKDYITGTQSEHDTYRRGLESFTADGMDIGRKIQLKVDLEQQCVRVTDVTYPLNQALGIDFKIQHVYIPEYALDSFSQLLQNTYTSSIQPLAADQRTTGNLRIYRSRIGDWKAKATVSTQETSRGMERIVTIVSRSPAYEHGFFQIPWMLMHKLVQAYARSKECYQDCIRARQHPPK